MRKSMCLGGLHSSAQTGGEGYRGWTLFLALSLAIAGSPEPAKAITLPVEVMGPAGTVVPVQVSVPAGTGNTIKRLWMKLHNASYANKISVQYNGSAWYTLNNNTTTVLGPAKRYGGFGGGFHTIEATISVPPSVMKDGANTLRFRFNATDGVSHGFRVLAFNFWNSAGSPVLPVSAFTQEDPADWQPVYSDSESIAEGKRLWQSARLRPSPGSATLINATCSSCHVPSGYDLKYFNYSNHSIATRAQFHGLSRLQGDQIASYIRSLNAPSPGRPWNPPYQPGPGIDSKPLSDWSAGAGLEWALDSDLKAVEHLFPGGNFTLGAAGKVNLREIPISLQLPDWNNWLPRVHPRDAWGSAFQYSEFNKMRNVVRDSLAAAEDRVAYVLDGYFTNSLSSWHARRQEFLSPRTTGVEWSPSYSEMVYSTALWQLSQLWGIMRELDVEGYGPPGDERSWYGNIVFFTSPFTLKIPSSAKGLRGSGLVNEYLSSAWYHTQAIVNVDNLGKPYGQSPIDWAYMFGKMKDLYMRSKQPEPIRLASLVAKAIQVWDNPNGLNITSGWSPHTKADVSRLVHVSTASMWTAVDPALRTAVLQSLLQAWTDKTLTYTPAQYYAGGYTRKSYIPKEYWSSRWGDKVRFMLPEFEAAGVDTALIDRLYGWAKTMWPDGSWDLWRYP